MLPKGVIWRVCHGEAKGMQSINAEDEHSVCGRCRLVFCENFPASLSVTHEVTSSFMIAATVNKQTNACSGD